MIKTVILDICLVVISSFRYKIVDVCLELILLAHFHDRIVSRIASVRLCIVRNKES